ncbi:MAG: ATP:cob(I)alamin adenosyltransferase, monofunctional PduO type [Parcubacteria group bacterium Gr01-1014_13]|nr:MAG: ATP:cob(I)alamin adenosyltransferase, monofunctional PduO type [Parcubacteria group bacterium Gr01-1014_13]
MKIYTKTGDTGETGLLGGKRVSKGSLEMQLIGEVDELNAALGVAVLFITEEKLKLFIQDIQRDLFKVGAELAALQTTMIERLEKVGNTRVGEMEKMIDEFWAQLPELKNFILPSGSAAGAHLHLARVICRRVERELVAFGQTIPLRSELYIYLNRLSDFLFASARYVNFKAGEEEIKV